MLNYLIECTIFKKILIFNVLVVTFVWFKFSFDGINLIWFLSNYFVV